MGVKAWFFRTIPMGPRSVLFGAHQFLLHPLVLARSWWVLYGFPFDPRLWASFFLHDLGYFFLWHDAMDDAIGESHPEFGARIMHWLFDRRQPISIDAERKPEYWVWHDFTLYHSRFYAKQHGAQPSKLCIADKYAITLVPAWVYLPMVRATGEIDEYMRLSKSMNDVDPGKYAGFGLRTQSQRIWYRDMQNYVRRWVLAHKDGQTDTWTGTKSGESATESGVWK